MHTSAPPWVIHVKQAGSIAATCTVNGVWFAASIDALPPGHPDALLVAAKCLVAGAILRGDAVGPYDDLEAEILAQIMLSDGPAAVL